VLFQDLDVYKLSVAQAIDVHKLTLAFPKSEGYALADQMRRAAYSIPSNIAEGALRNASREYAHFLGIARGSCAELRTLFTIGHGLGYLGSLQDLESRTEQISKLLTGLHRSVQNKVRDGSTAKVKSRTADP